MGKVNLLDCTLRDGGYINDWRFGEEAIKGTAQKIAKTGVEFFEIGFIRDEPFSKDRAVFPSVQAIEQYISHKSSKMKYVGMVDCGNPIPINKIRPYNGKSIDGIRVIFKKDRCDFAFDYCKKIKEKGYLLFVQFVGTDSYSDVEFIETISRFNELNPYAMSIVDTFGTIKHKAFLRMVYIADNNMNPNIMLGYHAHNNLQQAFSNAQTLVELNLQREVCIDACVFGMGRGAGNLNLELFADYMNENYGSDYKIEPMLEVMDDYLQEAYNKRFWGYCLPYYLSAINNCHPNYAIYYAEKQSLTEKSFNELLKTIPNEIRRAYSKDDAERFYEMYMANYYDDHVDVRKLSNKFDGRDILLLAPGGSIIREHRRLKSFINEIKPIVISLNCEPTEYKLDYVFISNMKRFSKLQNSNLKRIITSNLRDVKNYAFKLNFSSYSINDCDFIDNSGLMLLRFLSTTNVKNVYVAGMDGYTKDCNYYDATFEYEYANVDNRNKIIRDKIYELSKKMNVIFLTKTVYGNFDGKMN